MPCGPEMWPLARLLYFDTKAILAPVIRRMTTKTFVQHNERD